MLGDAYEQTTIALQEAQAKGFRLQSCVRERVATIEQALEALLFVAEGPLRLEELARAAGCTMAEVEAGLTSLQEALEGRGLRLNRADGHVQMVTAPETSPVVQRFLGAERPARLSSAALEVLAIIAYRQPVTRAQVEAIRGVSSEAVIRTLIARGLVEPVGRLEQAGRPELLGTTLEFLQYLGISSLQELPPLQDPSEETGVGASPPTD